MTTYMSFYTIIGEEVLVYKHILEKWRASIKDRLDDFKSDSESEFAANEELDLVEGLIEATHGANGETQQEVKGMLQSGSAISLRRIFDEELKKVLDSEKRDATNNLQSKLLERVSAKVTRIEMSSTSW